MYLLFFYLGLFYISGTYNLQYISNNLTCSQCKKDFSSIEDENESKIPDDQSEEKIEPSENDNKLLPTIYSNLPCTTFRPVGTKVYKITNTSIIPSPNMELPTPPPNWIG